MKIAIGTDHRGRELKLEIINHYREMIEFYDCSEVNNDTDDYPDFAFKVGESTVNGTAEKGILICGTGIGMSIAANKVKGVRCALVHNVDEAKFAREHNDANVIAFGSSMELDEMIKCIDIFINTDASSDEKHKRRVNKIINYECGAYYEL